MLGALLNPINATMIATALPAIGRDFDAGVHATGWLVSALYLAAAIGQPAAGRIADVIGPRRVFVGGLGIVLIAGVVGAFAPSLAVLVLARVLLGFGTATGFPTALAIIRRRADEMGTDVPKGALGALALAGQTSLAIGPVLGGVLVGQVGWRAVLAINVPIAIAGAVLAFSWLPRDAERPSGVRRLWRALDVPGMLLFAATITLLLLAIMGLDGAAAGSAAALWLATIGFGVALVRRELRCSKPFLDIRMLATEAGLTATILRHAATFIVLYAVMFGLPQWLEDGRGLRPEAVGLVMLPMLLVGIASTAIASRLRGIHGPLVIGTTALVAGSVALLTVDASVSIPVLLLIGVLFGIPNGMNFVVNQMALYQQTPADRMGSASGLFRTGQYVGSVLASTLIGVAYGERASDDGLHTLAVLLVVMAALVLLGTLASRRLLPRIRVAELASDRPVT
jgi:MFS family permease